MIPVFEEHPKKKGRCPKCGKYGKFRYYEGLSHEYGRCERINSCGYHAKPGLSALKTHPITSNVQNDTKTVFLSKEKVEQYLSQTRTAFHDFCQNQLEIPLSHLQEWKVGGNEKSETIFIHYDKSGNPLNSKTISYNPDGKRNKSISPRYEKSPNNCKHDLCLYGLHLFDSQKLTMLVESEKTAVIASHSYPEYNWLAMGGALGLTMNKASDIVGTRVIYLPDADEAGRNPKVIKVLNSNSIKCATKDLFPGRSDGFDIADAITSRTRFSLNNLNELIDENKVDLASVFTDDYKINDGKLIRYLESFGFGTTEIRSEQVFVRLRNNILYDETTESMRHFFIEKCQEDEKYYERAIKYAPTRFKSTFLNSLRKIDIKRTVDTPDATYYFYKNTVMKITAQGFEELSYLELKHPVHIKSILQREYYHNIAENTKDEYRVFEEFLLLVTNNDDSRFYILLGLLGYLMNNSFRKRKAVGLYDANRSDHPEGRTGKSLIAKALGHMKPTAWIDGKSFDPTSQFRFQAVKDLDQIMVIDDLVTDQRFDFSRIFNAITEGVQIEKKNKNPYVSNLKILLTSNKTIQAFGSSATDRLVEFELFPYFNKDNSPSDHFGKWFFDEWSENEWLAFDLTMQWCSYLYHKNGIVEPSPIYLKIRRVMDATTRNSDLFDFCEEIERDHEHSLAQLIENYKSEYPDYSNLRSRTFSTWLQVYTSAMGLKFEKRKSNSNILIQFKSKK